MEDTLSDFPIETSNSSGFPSLHQLATFDDTGGYIERLPHKTRGEIVVFATHPVSAAAIAPQP